MPTFNVVLKDNSVSSTGSLDWPTEITGPA